MFTMKRGGGSEVRQRQRQEKKVFSFHSSTWNGRPTSAEQSINPASVRFMRHWVRASLPEGTYSSTGQ